MNDICFLGTGGAVATEERDNMSFLIDHDETLILVDCPGSVIQKIKKFNYDPRKVSSILVTHIHPDHIYGLPSFVHSLMLDKCLIRLFGSKETVQFCQNLLDLFYLRDEKIKAKIEFVSVEPGEDFKLKESLQCASFKVAHSSSSLAYYFRFEEEKKELLYSGDTALNPLLFKEASGIDYLIHDCSAPSRFFKKYPSLQTMHTHSLELGKFSQQAEVKCLIPCHFFGELEFLLSEIEDEIRENYKGRIVIPEDFKKITL
ncbi:MAG: MBL fold metallo-hydrolase [Candidatus Aminicenantes bacterium]|nr:MBL fold metallo-hydrolase [Candidatus Aminicenantes bacterium]